MMGQCSGGQKPLFYSFNLDDHVPADHLLRGIDRFLDLSELRRHMAPFYSHTGRPSVDPELMVRMLIVGYSFGIRSERRLCDGLAQRCAAVVADGVTLPFRDASFDALSHSDVLCCTPDKLGVLQACRRVARDGSRMAFTSIALAPALADTERRIAMESGPKFVDMEDDYAVLLGQSGWCLQERTDLTAALLQYMRAELDGMQDRADALAQVFGSEEFAERMSRQQATIAAIDSGFLRRELFVARPADEDSASGRVT